jgi:hypothetical protein
MARKMFRIEKKELQSRANQEPKNEDKGRGK